jgi:hypothetical protein
VKGLGRREVGNKRENEPLNMFNKGWATSLGFVIKKERGKRDLELTKSK